MLLNKATFLLLIAWQRPVVHAMVAETVMSAVLTIHIDVNFKYVQ